MIVKPSQVEAALAYKDGQIQEEAHWNAGMAEIEFDEAFQEAKLSFNEGSVDERKARATLIPDVRERRRKALKLASIYVGVKARTEACREVISLYQTESKNAREGVL